MEHISKWSKTSLLSNHLIHSAAPVVRKYLAPNPAYTCRELWHRTGLLPTSGHPVPTACLVAIASEMPCPDIFREHGMLGAAY